MKHNALLDRQTSRPVGAAERFNLKLIGSDDVDETESASPVVVRKIGPGGMTVTAEEALPIGGELAIDLPGGQHLLAQIAWIDGQTHGCVFETPLDSQAIDALPGEAAAEPGTNVEPAETFGARLRRERLSRSLSQVDLAKMLGVSKVTVWNWENDNVRPRERALERLSTLLAMPVQALLFGEVGAAASIKPCQGREGGIRELITACKEAIASTAGIRPEDVEINLSFSN